MPDPLKNEQPHHLKAFEEFYALGDHRTYAKLAELTGHDIETIRLWGRSFSWSRRAAERDAEQARAIADEALVEHKASRVRNLKIVRAALVRLAKLIASGDIKPRIGDLERLVKLEEYLTGGTPGNSLSGSGTPSNVHIYIPDNGRGPKPEGSDETG